MKQELEQAVTSAVKQVFGEDTNVELTRTSEQFGDYATNVALQLAGKLHKPPREVAEALATALQGNLGSSIRNVSVAGPGFINISLPDQYFVERAARIAKGEFGFTDIGHGRPTVVEYSSPNIAKPFTIGHLRSTIIGDVIANLFEAIGYHVYRDNHLGDWGSQFGKQIYAIKNIPLREYPSEANIEQENEQTLDASANPIKDLVALYIAFHEQAERHPELDDEGRKWFKKLEDGDPEARRLWQKCIDWSFKEFDRIYGELGVPSWPGKHFENNGRGYGEAFFENKMEPVIDELKAKGLLKESKGAQLVFYPNDVLPPLMILKQDGATLYATRDLATDKFRLATYGKEVLVINEVGAEQSLYWQQIFMLEEMLGWYQPGQRVHVGHGHFRWKDGKMSTRKGNVVWLDEVLKEAVERAKALGSNDEVTVNQVAMGALKWNDLKRGSQLDVTFDWDEILNMQGNSGPYVQYSFVRTKSILAKAKAQNLAYQFPEKAHTLNDQEAQLLRQLDKFAETVEQAALTYSPNTLTQYLFDLAQAFNNFYQKYRILNAEPDPGSEQALDVQGFRLGLTAATGNVLKKGLELLGIVAPDTM